MLCFPSFVVFISKIRTQVQSSATTRNKDKDICSAFHFITVFFSAATNGMLIYNRAKTLNSYQELKRNFVAKKIIKRNTVKVLLKQKAVWLL